MNFIRSKDKGSSVSCSEASMSMLLERDRVADVRVRLLAKTLGEKTNTEEGWEKRGPTFHHKLSATTVCPLPSVPFSSPTHIAWLIFQWGTVCSACDHLKQSDEEKNHLNLGVQAHRKRKNKQCTVSMNVRSVFPGSRCAVLFLVSTSLFSAYTNV